MARHVAVHGVSWLVVLPVALFALLYVTLLITPIPLPFVAERARAMATESMGDQFRLTLGSTYLALENGAPVLRFEPVALMNPATTGVVEMEALEVGFSPLNALRGQPGAVISLVAPKLQVIQDLLGPRLARFEIEEGEQGERPILTILSGAQVLPEVSITSQGLDVRNTSDEMPTVEFRSDSEWLVLNLLAGEAGLRDVAQNARKGLFSKLLIRDADVEMFDAVFGAVREFRDMQFSLDADATTGNVTGEFTADIAGEILQGTVARYRDEDGIVHMDSTLENANLSAVAPFMDDPDSMTAFRGTSNVVSHIQFEDTEEGTDIIGGHFEIDMSGMQMRIDEDFFPVHSAIMDVDWDASASKFTINPSKLNIAESQVTLSGVAVMGVDPTFGPTVRMTMSMKDIYIYPGDMDAPAVPFDEALFVGWSAPLYGTFGIDQFVLTRDEMKLVAAGRADLLISGPGMDMQVGMQNATADDLKRIWPYFVATPTRQWVLDNIHGGTIKSAQMQMKFPAGSIPDRDEEWVWQEDSMSMSMVAENVLFSPTQSIEPILAEGETLLSMDDGDFGIEFGDGVMATSGGGLSIVDAGFAYSPGNEEASPLFSLHGNVDGPISALTALLEEQAADRLANVDLPISLSSLTGHLSAELDAAFPATEGEFGLEGASYSITGNVRDFASTEKLMDRSISEGQFAFDLNNAGYSLNGPTNIDGLTATLDISGQLEEGAQPDVALSAKFGADDLKDFGFDTGDLLSGTVTFRGEPEDDGSISVSVDLADAGLNIEDIGLRKARGTAGTLEAKVAFSGPAVDVTGIALDFGSVSLRGDLKFDQDDGLVSADFSRFRLSQGDNVRLSLRPQSGGFGITIRGQQLDLKPLMSRFFSLEGGSGGPSVDAVDQAIRLDAEIERVLGFYSTTAFNMDVDLSIRGADIRNASLQGQFGSGNGISVTTNQLNDGKVISIAFNGLGQILRFAGIYSQMAGGSGTLVLTTKTSERADYGELAIRNFSILNEANVAQVLGNHADSRALIARGNRMDIESGEATFVRRSDRIEITNAVVDGGSIGGTARGFIYTDAGQYDLTGTYIPLFGLNNAFQQLPILGRILGGRDGEGLIGVTFAVRGPLNEPRFLVNPASLLVPGAFRGLFEFRARELPQESAN